MKNSLTIALAINFSLNYFAQNCPKQQISSILIPIPNCKTGDFELIFEDNFNGNQIDVSKWNVRETVIRGFTHVGEVQWLSPDNVITINGSLNSIIINLCKD